MIPIEGVDEPKNQIFFIRERFSAFLNTRHNYITLPYIFHLFYKNVINDINGDISAVVKVVVIEILFSPIISFIEISVSLAYVSKFFVNN